MPSKFNKRGEEEFRREDCNEAEFKDNGPKKRRKRGDKAIEVAPQQLISTEYMPTSLKKLRACRGCKLVLNRQKWTELGRCPNCPSTGGIADTTESFSNVIGQIYPKLSWVAQYQGMKDLIPGVYAINVDCAGLEEEYEDF